MWRRRPIIQLTIPIPDTGVVLQRRGNARTPVVFALDEGILNFDGGRATGVTVGGCTGVTGVTGVTGGTTGGGAAIVMLIAAVLVVALRSSQARAVMLCVPAGALLQVAVNGAATAVATTVPLARNSTRVTVPSA